MAKKSKVVANNRKIELVKRYRERRDALRLKAKNIKLTEEERFQAQLDLQKLPRDSAPIRVRNRCMVSGRPRAIFSRFKLSRLMFRDLALRGEIPGVVKASW